MCILKMHTMNSTTGERTLKRKASSQLDGHRAPRINFHRTAMATLPDDLTREVGKMRCADWSEGYQAGYDARRSEEAQAMVLYVRIKSIRQVSYSSNVQHTEPEQRRHPRFGTPLISPEQ